MTNQARWQRAVEVCEHVWSGTLTGEGQALDRACDGDRETRDLVTRLLEGDVHAREFLEAPPVLILEDETPERVPALDRGTRIGRYEIVRKIADGGMGEVYEARQDRPARSVALKLLPAGYASSGAAKRFEREAEVLGRLRHPNIAQIHDAGAWRRGSDDLDRPYLVMELIDGVRIDEYVKAAELSIDERIRLFLPVCDAVQHAHQRGIIHRDIKPSNVLVTEIDELVTPKVIDFGIAHLDDEDWTQTVTDSSRERLVGSIPYMSPEQVSGGTRDVEARSDVYSLGVLLYELLTGHLPYDGDVVFQFIRAIGAGEVIPPRRRDAKVPRDLQAIVLHALETQAEHRYQSVLDLRLDLRCFLDGDPVPVAHRSAVGRAVKIAKKHKTATVAAALMALVVSLGVAGTAWQAIRATRSEARALDRMQDLRGLTKALIFELPDSIDRIRGATEARHLLVERGLEYLDLLALEGVNDPELMRELAEGYHRLAMVLGHSNSPNLGDIDTSLARFGDSIQWRRRLAANDDFDATRELAVGLMWRGFLLGDVGRIDEAMADLTESCELSRSLCERRPDSWEARAELAECAQGAVIRLDESGHLSERNTFAAHWAGQLESLPSLPVESDEERYWSAEVQFCLGVMLGYLDRVEASIGHFDQAAAKFERRAAADPDDHIRWLTYGDAPRYAGLLLHRVNRDVEALEVFEIAERSFRRATEAKPEDIRGPDMTATVLTEQSMSLLALGQVDDAIEAASESVRITRELMEGDRGNLSLSIRLAIRRYWCGRALLAAAEQEYRSLADRRELAEAARSEFDTADRLATDEAYPPWAVSRDEITEHLERCVRIQEELRSTTAG